MRKIGLAGVVAAFLSWAAVPAFAVDGMAIEGGTGDSTDMGRIAIQWDWGKRWFQGKEWHVGGYWDLGLGYWNGETTIAWQNDSIVEMGLTPVFRLQRNELAGPYAEIGIGIHLMSRTQIGDKRMSTSFQFGDHFGVGYRFGAKSAWDVSYRYQHLSNGGIKTPNDGINFQQVRLQYHF